MYFHCLATIKEKIKKKAFHCILNFQLLIINILNSYCPVRHIFKKAFHGFLKKNEINKRLIYKRNKTKKKVFFFVFFFIFTNNFKATIFYLQSPFLMLFAKFAGVNQIFNIRIIP